MILWIFLNLSIQVLKRLKHFIVTNTTPIYFIFDPLAIGAVIVRSKITSLIQELKPFRAICLKTDLE